jgi:hypothetical protein
MRIYYICNAGGWDGRKTLTEEDGMKRNTVVSIQRKSDGSIDVALSNGAIGNFDKLSQGYEWATQWCGVSPKQYKALQQATPDEQLWGKR